MDPRNCRGLMEALAALCQKHHDEPALRDVWATCVTNFVADRAADDPGGCRKLLEILATLYQAHPDEPVLREEWARGVANFVRARAAGDPRGCRDLVDALAALHQMHRDEPALREQWALSVMNFVTKCTADNSDSCGSLLNTLAVLHQAYRPAHSELTMGKKRNEFRGAPSRRRSRALPRLLEDLAAWNSMPALREAWATGVTNFVGHCAAQDPNGCQVVILGGASPGAYRRTGVREQWANSVSNLVVVQCRERSRELH